MREAESGFRVLACLFVWRFLNEISNSVLDSREKEEEKKKEDDVEKGEREQRKGRSACV